MLPVARGQVNENPRTKTDEAGRYIKRRRYMTELVARTGHYSEKNERYIVSRGTSNIVPETNHEPQDTKGRYRAETFPEERAE